MNNQTEQRGNLAQCEGYLDLPHNGPAEKKHQEQHSDSDLPAGRRTKEGS